MRPLLERRVSSAQYGTESLSPREAHSAEELTHLEFGRRGARTIDTRVELVPAVAVGSAGDCDDYVHPLVCVDPTTLVRNVELCWTATDAKRRSLSVPQVPAERCLGRPADKYGARLQMVDRFTAGDRYVLSPVTGHARRMHALIAEINNQRGEASALLVSTRLPTGRIPKAQVGSSENSEW